MPDPTPQRPQPERAAIERTQPEPVPDSGAHGSVWLTGQVCSRDQRRGRYLPASIAHPGKMLPAIARHAIATYTQPGELVLDPMCGIGTTLVEAVHLGRDAVGVEYEPRWAELASANVRHATAHGADGHATVWRADARHLPGVLPAGLHGRASLVLTSPPYGPSTHGQIDAPGAGSRKVQKVDHRYGTDRANLAYRSHRELAAAFADILTACTALLAPGGHLIVTARPYRRHGELIDIPAMVIAAGTAAGLTLHDRAAALLAGIRNGATVPRASFFQLREIRRAHAHGDPQSLIAHEDVLVFSANTKSERSAQPRYSQRETVLGQPQTLGCHPTSSRSATHDARPNHRLDSFTWDELRVSDRPMSCYAAAACMSSVSTSLGVR